MALDTYEGGIYFADNADATKWYGISALIMGTFAPVVYILLKDWTYVALNKDWYMAVTLYFWPAGIAWLFSNFFDTNFMRAMLRDLYVVSLAAPFFHDWYNVYTYWMDNYEVQGEETNFWLSLAFYAGHIITLQMIPQLYWVPQALDDLKEKHGDSDSWGGIFNF